MKYRCVSAALAVSVFGVASQSEAQEVSALEPIAPVEVATRAPQYMRVFGNAQPPYGFVRFCESQPEGCQNTAKKDDLRLQATPDRLSELDEINRTVNHEIEPATDMEIYGVNELWTLPKSRGDCEDFALLKRQELMKRGWPANSLLMTVVRDEKNEGHAVLTARLSTGDYVLDNKVEQVKMWNQTPYHYVMRQSYLDPKVWVSLDATDGTASPPAIAGVKPN